ncbi:MAG: sulfite exporter TauE/SafE family protein [Trueperaceae bacterium]|nr:sulfite exporter TauE/SafE family protein [Trueperaceae bacterium]
MDAALVGTLAVAILLIAALYSAVGHGGASGYLAAMALFGLAPEVMKPTALALNVLVSGLALWRFSRAEGFAWRTFALFAATSVPMAFVGGRVLPPERLYLALISVALIVAALRLLLRAPAADAQGAARRVPAGPGLAWGGGIGFLSGLTGVGGGIFLHPLLQITGWVSPRRAAAVVAAFVLVNSLAGLAGYWSSLRTIPVAIAVWAPAALAGGLVGTGLGARRFGTAALQRTLAVVLLLAATRLGIGAAT